MVPVAEPAAGPAARQRVRRDQSWCGGVLRPRGVPFPYAWPSRRSRP
ncbi:hypothetical protein ACFFX0_28155 [Citricoccus parietis]|uniref:Uncharacterized protein n=1 Tax=Citricoccus parietis TaxID=592307 RepID=A0ABV5G7C2_9MICC